MAWAGGGAERSNAPAEDPVATVAFQSRRLIPLSLKERHDGHDGHDVRRRRQKINEMSSVWDIIADDSFRSQMSLFGGNVETT